VQSIEAGHQAVDLRRLRAGEWMLAAAGALAVASPFLPWYRASGSDLTGWEALSVVDAVLFATGLVAIGVVAFTAEQSTAAAPIAAQALFTLLAGVVCVVVWVRVLKLPDGLDSREVGAWLAVAGAPAMVVAALIAMRDERPSAPGRPTDTTGVPVESQREIETLPAPPRS
jgi:hypothetical protein